MAMDVTIRARVRLGRIWRLYGTLAFSGTCPVPPGETLSFANRGLPQGVAASRPPLAVSFKSAAGVVYAYTPGSGRDNGAVIPMCERTVATNALLLAHTNVSYVAGVTGDTVGFVADFAA